MNCQQARERIDDRYDGSPPLADSTDVAEHLRSCSHCRLYDAQMREIDAGLAELRAATILSSDPSVPGTTIGSPRRSALWRVSRIAAAVALLIGPGLVIKSLLNTGGLEKTRDQTSVGAIPSSYTPTLRLAPQSADRFIAVSQPTDDPHVHLIWLHATLPPPKEDAPESSGRQGSDPPGLIPATTVACGADCTDAQPERVM